MSAELQDAATAVRQALNATPRGIEDTYAALADLDELAIVLAGYTRRLAESVRRLPGIVNGLRVDDPGGPIEPEQLRHTAAAHLAAAGNYLDLAQDGISGAHEAVSRLYLEEPTT